VPCCGGDEWLLRSDKDRNQKLGLVTRATRTGVPVKFAVFPLWQF
jgi:hypothetical protein